MTLTISAAVACIRIQDTASSLLETYGMASTERIASECGAAPCEVRAVMADLFTVGAVAFSQGLQVWVVNG